MKKYLLLATTAMLFAGNAMAGSIAEDGQSAIINAKVALTSVDTIASVQDIDFATLAIPDDFNWNAQTKLATISPEGIVTGANGVIASSLATPSQGKVSFTNYAHDLSFECVNGGGDPTAGAKCLTSSGSGMYIGDVIPSPNGKTVNIGASVYALGDGNLPPDDTYAPSFRVTIKY